MSMTLEELGLVLRTEREKRNLSLDDVAETLKVSAKVLRGIESGDKESLPHAVYVRGFILSYGKMLGLDTADFLTVEGLYDADEMHTVQSYKETSAIHTSKGKAPIILIVIVLLCAVGAALVWAYRDADLFSKLQNEHLTTAQPAPPLPSATMQNPVAPAQNDSATSEVSGAKNTETVPENSQKTPEESLAAQSETTPEENAAAENEPLEESAAEAVLQLDVSESQDVAQITEEPVVLAQTSDAQAQDGPHKVIITSVAPCWIHSTADDTDTRQFSLERGDTFALTFNENLVLKLGNAGGVRIHYNGKELPPPGKDGQVKTLRFPIQ